MFPIITYDSINVGDIIIYSVNKYKEEGRKTIEDVLVKDKNDYELTVNFQNSKFSDWKIKKDCKYKLPIFYIKK